MNMLSVPNYNRIGRLVDELFESAQNNRSSFSPACEIKESVGHYEISFEIPGVDISNVSIEAMDRNLIVQGTKDGAKDDENIKAIFNERHYGDFERKFALPEDANIEKIEAKYRNGILTLEIAKVEQTQPKRINIKINED